MPQEELAKVLECALNGAHILLENGAETYRAEELALRVCQRFGIADTQVLALPTGAFITLTQAGEVPVSGLRRVKKRTTDLKRVDDALRVSREISRGEMPLDEGIRAFAEIAQKRGGGRIRGLIAASVSSACFAVLFGGGWFDFLAAALCGGLVQWLAASFRREDSFHFIISLMGGAVIALCAALLTGLTGLGSQTSVIAGALMPLLPGLAMTNAIRDTMRGDLVSGVARAAEALLVAVALAAGVGVVLGAQNFLAGVMG